MTHALPRLSYFEFWDLKRDVYVSLFPTDKTVVTNTGSFPKEGDKVFPDVFSNEVEFLHLFHAMKEKDFGFFDLFWFIPKDYVTNGSIRLDFIKTWMDSLTYVPGELTSSYQTYTLKSNLNPTFSQTVYVKNESLPQEAIDVIPVFKSDENMFVALGNKKKSPIVSIKDRISYEKSLLTVGKHGFVIFGEHLNPDEKKMINELGSRFQREPIEMKEREISSSLRTLFEEGGFKVDTDMGRFYYIHQDNRPCRDDRYWTYETDEFVFGYKRKSVSHTILVLMKGSVPETMNDPNDTDECEKGAIVSVKNALDLLADAGAFFSHVFQLSIALNCPLFNDFSRFFGKTFREVMQEYPQGAVRVAMIGDRGVYVSPTDYSNTRLNVCVSDDGVVNRILGFY